MYDDVIKFSNRNTDLEKTEELWVGTGYDDRLDDIMDNIVKTTGFAPSKNMQPIREGVFQIMDSTTVDDLKDLAERIKEVYLIDCFQIAIDRDHNTAHMLFDFNIRDKGKSVVLNRSEQIVLSVMILRYLDLPRPECADEWMGYFLKGRYTDDEDVFENWLNNLKHKKLNKNDFNLAKEMSIFVKQMCQGMAVFGIRKKNKEFV